MEKTCKIYAIAAGEGINVRNPKPLVSSDLKMLSFSLFFLFKKIKNIIPSLNVTCGSGNQKSFVL